MFIIDLHESSAIQGWFLREPALHIRGQELRVSVTLSPALSLAQHRAWAPTTDVRVSARIARNCIIHADVQSVKGALAMGAGTSGHA